MLWGIRPLQRGFLLVVGPSPGLGVEILAGLGGFLRKTPNQSVQPLVPPLVLWVLILLSRY